MGWSDWLNQRRVGRVATAALKGAASAVLDALEEPEESTAAPAVDDLPCGALITHDPEAAAYGLGCALPAGHAGQHHVHMWRGPGGRCGCGEYPPAIDERGVGVGRVVPQTTRQERLYGALLTPHPAGGLVEGRVPQRRLRVVPEDPEAKCGGCRHFDLEAGQARLRRHHVFAERVAPFIAPHEYGEVVTVEADGTETVRKPDVPEVCDWLHFGLCREHGEGVWRSMTRDNRLANAPDWTPEGVDCYEPAGSV